MPKSKRPCELRTFISRQMKEKIDQYTEESNRDFGQEVNVMLAECIQQRDGKNGIKKWL